MKIDFVHGERDYIRAVDLVTGSPLPKEAERFRFVFRQLVRSPGEWIQGRHAIDPAATLEVRTITGVTYWSFMVAENSGFVRRLPDVREDGLLRNPIIRGSTMTCILSEGASLWAQIVAATRIGGQRHFPYGNWYLIYLEGNAGALRDEHGGALLTLNLGRRKGHIIELTYAIDDFPAGRIGLYAR